MHGADVEEHGALLACGVSDCQNWLISADEPLASLQRGCGGELPGLIAIPELLELVRKARRYRFGLARTIQARDELDMVKAWVEVDPLNLDEPGDEGCRIALRSWQVTTSPPDDTHEVLTRRALLDREVAELSARLDGEQRILTVVSDSPDLSVLAARMSAGIGRPFHEFLSPQGFGSQVLHWRLMDDAPVVVEGSLRDWRTVLLPHGVAGQEQSGFELLLVSDEPALVAAADVMADQGVGTSGRRTVIGAELAPVLRQPIARIVANAETIRARLAGPLPDAYAEYATDIANAGRLLLGLLDDLGDLEALEAEDFTTAPDPIDLAEVARQAAGILSLRAQEKGIIVEAPGMDESLPVIAEFRRALQVLINLIGNAIRYSPERSRIWIGLDQEGARARVVVTDEGPGLSAQDQAIVFEKFERLGRTGDGGSGLGLYISRRLARAMGGDLSIESAPGQGARFILEVPFDLAAQSH